MRRTTAMRLALAMTFAGGLPDVSVAAPAQQHLILSDGNRLAYRQYGTSGSAVLAPIIVLHGGPGVPLPEASFDFYGRLAGSGHDVYVYDQIGVGGSSRLDDVSGYTVQRDVDDLDALRVSIGAQHFILIGQSWGAVLAVYYLAQHPDAVDRMALISPGAFRHLDRFASDYSRSAAKPGGLPLELAITDVLSHIDAKAALSIFGQAELGRAYDAFWADPRSADALSCPGYRRMPTRWARPQGANYAALLMTDASLAKMPDPTALLRQARVRTVILHAECDFVPRTVAEDYVAALPNARIVDIAGAGHAATDAKPEEIAAILDGFLAEN